MDQQQFEELIERYLSDQSTQGEIEELRRLLENPEYLGKLEALMDRQLADSSVSPNDLPGVAGRLKDIIENEITRERKVKKIAHMRLMRNWAAVAAVLVLIVSAGLIWFYNSSGKQQDNHMVVTTPANIEPGKDGAILTLSDGRTIVLDSAGNGLIANESGSQILLDNGQLVYKSGNASNIVYNTVSTPKGRQFRLILPDGTRAWLNAASSLRYPIAFTGRDRSVEVTGEVYFEVIKNSKPFKVQVNEKMEVAVLGTQFNINSYDNEASINTTLLEGSVQITNGNERQILRPGQQAQVNGNEKIKIVSDVNLRKVMAWKNGVFDFNDASLQEVMHQLERWYDIEVVYEKGVPDIEFFGTIERDLNLEDVLKGLKLSEVNFRVEGRKLIVMP